MTDAQKFVIDHHPDAYCVVGNNFFGIWGGSEYIGVSRISEDDAWEWSFKNLQLYMIRKLET